MSCYTSLYNLLFNWQTLIAGLLALISALAAGILAYVAGLRQVEEIRRQNHFLQKSESRRIARMVLSAARILEGILKVVEGNIGTLNLAGSLDMNIALESAYQIRQSIEPPPRYEIIEQLQYLGHEIIENYFSLCTQIDVFRKRDDFAVASSLQYDLQNLSIIVNHIRDEITEESKNSLELLSAADEF